MVTACKVDLQVDCLEGKPVLIFSHGTGQAAAGASGGRVEEEPVRRQGLLLPLRQRVSQTTSMSCSCCRSHEDHRVGSRLPSEAQLSDAFGVSRPVVEARSPEARQHCPVARIRNMGRASRAMPSPAWPLRGASPKSCEATNSGQCGGRGGCLAAQRHDGKDLQVMARAIEAWRGLEEGRGRAEADIDFHRAVTAPAAIASLPKRSNG